LPKDLHTFGPFSLAQLLKDHPFLATQSWAYIKPVTLLSVLYHTDVKAMQSFMAEAPQALVKGLMPEVLYNVDRKTVSVRLPPIINMVSGHDAMIAVLQRVEFDVAAELLRSVPAEHILVALTIPARKLVAVLDALDPRQRKNIFVEVLTETPKVLERSFVPLLTTTQHPKRVAALANRVHIELLCCVLRGVPGLQLAAFIEATTDEDYGDHGHVTKLMKMVGDDYDLIVDKLVPLLARGDAVKMGELIHKVEPRQLLDVLRGVEVEGVLCLLENTHQALVIQTFRLPLEQSLAEIAGALGTAMQKHPFLAATIAHQSEQLVKHARSAKYAKRRLHEGLQTNLHRGKLSRGGSQADAYSFGDFTRGVVRKVSERRHPFSKRLPLPVQAPLEECWQTLS